MTKKVGVFDDDPVRSLVAAAFEAFIAHDGSTIIAANQRFVDMFGYESPDDVIGLPYTVLLAPDGVRNTARRVESMTEGEYLAICQRRQGDWFPVRVNAVEASSFRGRRCRIVAFRYDFGEFPGKSHAGYQWLGALSGTVRALALAIEQRDEFTAGNQSRVADLCGRLRRRIGLSSHEVSGITSAANVHDIGKISVPSQILMKPGRLNAEEFALVQKHSTTGAAIRRG